MSQSELPEHIVLMPPGDGRDYFLAALGMRSEFLVQMAVPNSWLELDAWIKSQSSWIFGFISYDAKNAIEKLSTRHEAAIRVPDIHLFVPECVIKYREGKTEVLHGDWNAEYQGLFEDLIVDDALRIQPKPVQSKAEYLSAVKALLHHIHLGDIYEVNYCQQFLADFELHAPLNLFKRLHSITNAPHSTYLRIGDLHLMCGSPERYLARKGNVVISQPIKGTIRRGKTEEEDARLKQELSNSPKEKAENIMIVDLVRNDLSRSAKKGSVVVEKLLEVQSFKTVHHLVSTVTAEMEPDVSFGRLICDTFPMGSMTGAPKVRAMELIDQYEYSARGLYSGTVGFITPEGDFDFNVVIRSLIYDKNQSKLIFSVGGAITAGCNPEAEYDECLLKAEALLKALS
ncbi:MAG: anthranilate synthase component I family protein [Flavobacteriales bacterium]|nr:anthranilate synthase component I family protein [Flavobacteriales bacterium]